MAKVNFTKVEQSFDKALQQLFINNLNEIATIVGLVDSPEKRLANKSTEEVIARFQKELLKIKEKEPLLFEKLNITQENEERLNRPAADYLQEDWEEIKKLKLRIDELKRELSGGESLSEENETIVKTERRRHINKRHNIRDGWLPLH